MTQNLSDWLDTHFGSASLSLRSEAHYGITPAEFAHLLLSVKGMATKLPKYLALLQ